MRPLGFITKRTAAEPIVFRGTTTSAANATFVSKPAGVAVGDLVVVAIGNSAPVTPLTLTTLSGSAWNKNAMTWATFGYESTIFWKILNATDVANNWNFSAATAYSCSAYAAPGATAAAVRATFNMPSSGIGIGTLPGFTPTAGARGLVSAISDRTGDPNSVFAPAGFTARIKSNQSTYWTVALADMPPGYAGGNLVWDVGDVYTAVGWCLEVT